MFKLVKDRTAWWPVTWDGVNEDGEIIENRVEVKFLIIGRKEFKKLFMDAGSDQDADQDDEAINREVAQRIMKDWKGIGDENGEPLPFEPEWVEAWLDQSMVPVAVLNAYMRLMAAAPEVREKNSGASPASGPAAAKAEGATNRRSRRSSAAGARRKKK